MVKLGQQILDPDIDYTVIYQNNVNIGTASVAKLRTAFKCRYANDLYIVSDRHADYFGFL